MLWCIGPRDRRLDRATSRSASPPGGRERRSARREIGRFGDYIGQSFLVIGGVVALAMAMAELDYFWIANVIYLGFVLSRSWGSTAKDRRLPTRVQTW